MINHTTIDRENLLKKIKDQRIRYAGNARLKIFGRLNCKSGKRMKKQHRVFFETETEAISFGFRPCGHCMPGEYKKWKLR
jgi:methylphosphotriester-DNA--protein-cysteine methyltransferase